jgi:Trp operon repressor
MVENELLREKAKIKLESLNLTKEEDDRLIASINYLSNLLIEECLQREHKKLIRK